MLCEDTETHTEGKCGQGQGGCPVKMETEIGVRCLQANQRQGPARPAVRERRGNRMYSTALEGDCPYQYLDFSRNVRKYISPFKLLVYGLLLSSLQKLVQVTRCPTAEHVRCCDRELQRTMDKNFISKKKKKTFCLQMIESKLKLN
jgi:hypothetical protein